MTNKTISNGKIHQQQRSNLENFGIQITPEKSFEISDIIELWNRNKEIIGEDVLYRSADRENGFNKDIFLKALGLVQYKVINMGGNKLEKYLFTGIEMETELAEHINYEKHV